MWEHCNKLLYVDPSAQCGPLTGPLHRTAVEELPSYSIHRKRGLERLGSFLEATQQIGRIARIQIRSVWSLSCPFSYHTIHVVSTTVSLRGSPWKGTAMTLPTLKSKCDPTIATFTELSSVSFSHQYWLSSTLRYYFQVSTLEIILAHFIYIAFKMLLLLLLLLCRTSAWGWCYTTQLSLL